MDPRINDKAKAFDLLFAAARKDGDCTVTDRYLNTGRDVRPRIRVNTKKQIGGRVVYEVVHCVELRDDQKVLHRCDNPRCINPDHLFLGTQADNVRDMKAKGRMYDRRGDNNYNRKIDAKAAREIRKKYAAGGWTQKTLAAEYGLGKSMVGYIVNGQFWKDA